MFVSGIIPAEIIYAPLLGALGDEIRAHLREVEIYEGRHHLAPLHLAEPERFARALKTLGANPPKLTRRVDR